MFGLKWLWKTNRGSNIDTSNFVSKEFLNTTLQDYVNRDLLNTTLSNELSNYVSTTSLNNTLNNYVLNSTLNTTLSSYVQTNTLNTTLSNYVSTNTAQTITGAKTFSNQVVINNTPEPLVIKATNTNKSYILFKTPQNTSTLSIGSNATGANIDINSGDLTIETQQSNKTITLTTGRVKLNNSALDLGTIINAGYGGIEVKFIPDDNSTKTLKFYENTQSDRRRFNLLVPEPTAAQNPATKNYVDTKETAINNQITAINNRIVENNTILKRTYTFTPSSSTPANPGNGEIYRYVLQITDLTNVPVIGISTNYQNQSNSNAKSQFWEVSYSLWNGGVNIQLTGDKKWYTYLKSSQPVINMNIDFSQFEITVFYMENANREAEQTYQGRIVPLEEVFGGNNEN